MVTLAGTMRNRERQPQAWPSCPEGWQDEHTWLESIRGYPLIMWDVQVWKSGNSLKHWCKILQEMLTVHPVVLLDRGHEEKWMELKDASEAEGCYVWSMSRWKMVPTPGDWKGFPKQWEEADALAKSEERKILLWNKRVADNMTQNFFLSDTRPRRSCDPACLLCR